MWDYHGFARVAKLISDRSDAKYIFKDWQAGNLRAVEELSVGTYVLALPRVDRDLRWCPIVTLDATEHARFYIYTSSSPSACRDTEASCGRSYQRKEWKTTKP